MEDAWFLLAVKRSSEVAKLEGGVSAFFGACLEALFTSSAADFAATGVLLEFRDGTSARLFLKPEQVIQEDAAHKMVWNCVGAVVVLSVEQ